MLPRCYPINTSGKVPLKVIADLTGLTKWVDYLPVKEVAATGEKLNRYQEDGSLDTAAAAAPSGVAWVDWLPAGVVVSTKPWRAESDGHIPVTDATP